MTDRQITLQPDDTLGQVVATSDGSLTLSHPEHGECYHTRAGALAEADQLYVRASGLAAAWEQGEHPAAVLDVGLGLGYTAIATLAAWADAASPGDLELTSLEINPSLVVALASGHASWQANWPKSHLRFCLALRDTGRGEWVADLPHKAAGYRCRWRIVVGDAAREPLPPAWSSAGYNYVWQDPFSPGKNPPLWSAPYFARLRSMVAGECRLMTYSVATAVRAALDASGWEWRKIPTTMPLVLPARATLPPTGTKLQRKRHWLTASPAGDARLET